MYIEITPARNCLSTNGIIKVTKDSDYLLNTHRNDLKHQMILVLQMYNYFLSEKNPMLIPSVAEPPAITIRAFPDNSTSACGASINNIFTAIAVI